MVDAAANPFIRVVSTTGALRLDLRQNTTLAGYMELSSVAAPANGAAGTGRLYKKATPDLGLYWKPEAAGTEYNLSVGTDLDYQSFSSSAALTTTSTTFADFSTSVTLTTAATRTMQYLVIFSASMQCSTANATVFAQVLVNGTANADSGTGTTIARTTAQAGLYPVVCNLITAPLAAGTVIKAQWRTTAGTATSTRRQLTVFGIE